MASRRVYWSYWNAAIVFLFLFFKQKTAYELRISDWSSDVCSSDLVSDQLRRAAFELVGDLAEARHNIRDDLRPLVPVGGDVGDQLGRASCRESVCLYV